MTIYIGADHGGFSLKEQLKEQLRSRGYQVEDVGASSYDETDDYPVYGRAVAEAVINDPESRGIALCRSGYGMVMAANKIAGARAALATASIEWLKKSRTDDDANILAFGVDFTDERQILGLAVAWLETPFEANDRHVRRIEEMDQPLGLVS